MDIENEKRYLFFLNPKLQELKKSRIQNIAIESLITDIIKKKELEKYFDFSQNNKIIDIVEKNLMLKKNIKNKENLEPTGFIHCKYKIYVSLDNGQLIIVNSSTGIQEKITKFHGSKISRPFIFKNSMYLIKDNGIIKIN